MDKEAFLTILGKYRAGEASAEEVEFLHAYYNFFEIKGNIFEEMDHSSKALLKEEIKSELDFKIAQTVVPAGRKLWRLNQILAAAAVLLVVGIAVYFINLQLTGLNDVRMQIAEAKVKDIAPGGNHAVLTLADGSAIKLDDQKNGLLTNQEGAVISKTKDGQIVYHHEGKAAAEVYNTISTPRGGQYQLVLADGTKVWLNAASSIRFPTVFAGKSRNVEITGEAYFEVTKNREKPFKVFSRNQEVEVLGTHFNLNTYEDEQYDQTTLLEGSVKVYRLNEAGSSVNAQTIIPGQVAIAAKGTVDIKVARAVDDEAIAWKNGYFKFSKADIKTIMRQVSRWYNVDVVYKGDFGNDLFGGKINRTDSVSGVLRILKLSNINTTIKGRTIIISN
ncbi:FecR family protein [Pedobacter nyackensis]|uniref:FecR family protein n=1 Tax=Pedobacter nyackensis TaxID=475255 RepID=UPI00292F8002|nr:FecR family protein [Pedobacter nyackensis]